MISQSMSTTLFVCLFHDRTKADYTNVPTVVFSHPPMGSCGLTEPEARAQFGDDVKIYTSKFTNLFYGHWQVYLPVGDEEFNDKKGGNF